MLCMVCLSRKWALIFLSAFLLAGCGEENGSQEPPATLEQNQRYDLLYRATFGPTPISYEQLSSVGYQQWLQTQFSQSPTLHLPLLRTYVSGEEAPNQSHRAGVWWDRVINAPDQLRQRVAFALSEIFVISRHGASLNGRSAEMADYYDMLLKNAFGNYRNLIEAVTLHPAMGDYLSMMANQKANPDKNRYPDENYAREVMQLFSIGLYRLNNDGSPMLDNKGALIPTYSQDDIENLARVFTSWHLSKREKPWWSSKKGDWFSPMVAHPEEHDFEQKTVMGEVFAQGQTPEADMAQAMDMLLNHPNTGPFLSRLLIQRLVTSNPSPQYIERVANRFADNGNGVRGDLKAVISAILLDEEALNGPVMKLKEPLVSMANLYRAMEAKTADPTGKYHNSNGTFWAYGQGPLASPSVFNFYSPDYAPLGEIKDGGQVAPEFEILSWNNFINISNQMWGASGNTNYHGETNPKRIVINAAPLELIANDHDALIAEIDRRFLGQEMSEELTVIVRQALEKLRDDKQALKVRNALHIVLNSQEFHVEERK